MNDAPCRDCASREVGCHAGCEKRRHQRWLDYEKRKSKGGAT